MTGPTQTRTGSNVWSEFESRRLTLRDGRVVDVRPLQRSDREGLAAAVERLSDQTRYLRFATGKPRLTKRELDYLVDVDHRRHEAIVAIDPTTRRGVGLVRYIEVSGEPDVAEIAATVTDDWQGQGLGTALLTRLAARARANGYSAFRASVLASNQRSIAMLLAAGFAPLPSRGVLREYELALAQPRSDVHVARLAPVRGKRALEKAGRDVVLAPSFAAHLTYG